MAAPDKIFEFIFVIFFALVGLCLGSFATAVIYRESKNKPWYSLSGHSARSYCPHCKANLGPLELIPLFSWLLLRGRCKNCKTPIPVFYPLLELVSGISGVIIYLIFGVNLAGFLILAGLPFFIALAYLIIAYKKLPQRLVTITTLIIIGAIFATYFNIHS